MVVWGFFICSMDILFSAYYTSDSILGPGDTAVSKTKSFTKKRKSVDMKIKKKF